MSVAWPELEPMRAFGRRFERALVPLFLLAVVLAAGCTPAAAQVPLVSYVDPGGRFSLMLPDAWRIEPDPGAYRLYAVSPAASTPAAFDAALGLTWKPFPCDKAMIDDGLTWYADILLWGAAAQELSRTETEVDGRRALLLQYVTADSGRVASRSLTVVTEAYGIIWELTCVSIDAARYERYESTFRTVVSSLEIHGAWSGLSP